LSKPENDSLFILLNWYGTVTIPWLVNTVPVVVALMATRDNDSLRVINPRNNCLMID